MSFVSEAWDRRIFNCEIREKSELLDLLEKELGYDHG